MPAAQQIEDMTEDFNPGYHKAGDTVDNMDRYYYLEMVEQLVASLAHLAGVGSTLPQTPAPTATDTPTGMPSPTVTATPTGAASQTPSPTTYPTTVAPTLPPPITSEPTEPKPTEPKPTSAPSATQSPTPELGFRVYLPFGLVESS